MRRPHLTIVIPYSGDATVKRTLRSLARQRNVRGKFEVIVVFEDTADTAPLNIRQPFPLRTERYARPKHFTRHSAGIMRNIGASHARGHHLVFIDSDCVLEENCLWNYCRVHQQHADSVICGKTIELPVEQSFALDYSFEVAANASYQDCRLEDGRANKGVSDCGWMDFYSCNASVPLKLFQASGGFDESGFRCHDSELAYKLYKGGASFLYSPDSEVIHVEHPRNLKFRLEQVDGWKLMCRLYPELKDVGQRQIILTKQSYDRTRRICEKQFAYVIAPLPGTRVGRTFVVSPRCSRAAVEKQLDGRPCVVSRGIDCTYYYVKLERNCWDYHLVHADFEAGSSPAVAVIVTTFNSSQVVAKAIQSVLVQTLQSFELIVVDDASFDDTVTVVDSFTSDGRVRLVTRDINAGQSVALNTGLELTRAPLLVQLDADDWLEPNALEVLVNEFENDPNALAIYGSPKIHRDNGKTVVENGYQLDSSLQALSYQPLQAPRAYRTSALRMAGGWDVSDDYAGRYFEDRRMLARLARHGPVKFLNRQIYHVREMPDSLSQYTIEHTNARYEVLWQSANALDHTVTGKVLRGGFSRSFKPRKPEKPTRSWSIIIPARNRPQLLTHCLTSWFQSDLVDTQAEIIVVDDASDIPLENALKHFAGRIRVIRSEKRRGPGWCRNQGAAEAANEMLFFCDGDHIVPPHVLQAHEQHYDSQQTASALVVGGLLTRRCFTYMKRPSAMRQRHLRRLLDLFRFKADFEDLAAKIILDTPINLVPSGENIWQRCHEMSVSEWATAQWIYLLLSNNGDLSTYRHRWMRVFTGNLSLPKFLIQ